MQISTYTKSLAALMAIGVMVPSASATNTEGMRKLATTSDKVVTMPEQKLCCLKTSQNLQQAVKTILTLRCCPSLI